MRGRNTVLAFVTTSFMTLLCQGCVHSDYSVSTEPAVGASRSMLLAAGQAPSASGQDLGFTIVSQVATRPGAQRQVSVQGGLPVAVMGPVEPGDAAATPGRSMTFGANPTRQTVSFDGAAVSSSLALQSFSGAIAAARISPDFEVRQDISGEIAFSAGPSVSGLPVDVGFAPRATLREQGGFTSRRIGAEVRFGENIDERGEGNSSRTWYVFAGADGEALCWDVGDKGLSLSSGVRLRDQITVGDIQAGVSMRTYGGELSLSYIHRQIEYRDRSTASASETEDFAGVSFTMRR